jgi:hypothetical protein
MMARVPLFIAGADRPEHAIDALLELDEPCGSCIVSSPPAIATLAEPRGWRDRSLHRLIERLGAAHGEIRRVTPPSLLGALRARASDWIEVDLGGRGNRLSRVTLARSLFDAEMLFAFTNLDRPRQRGERPAIAIGLWSTFARGWERLGARLSEDRDGLAPEIALAVVARRYFVTATLDQISFAVAASDPVVAELAGRAMLRLRPAALTDETVAPWEEPIVQRACELKLGVQTPDAIAVRSLWRGRASDANRFATLVRELSDLMSLPVPVSTPEPA